MEKKYTTPLARVYNVRTAQMMAESEVSVYKDPTDKTSGSASLVHEWNEGSAHQNIWDEQW